MKRNAPFVRKEIESDQGKFYSAAVSTNRKQWIASKFALFEDAENYLKHVSPEFRYRRIYVRWRQIVVYSNKIYDEIVPLADSTQKEIEHEN